MILNAVAFVSVNNFFCSCTSLGSKVTLKVVSLYFFESDCKIFTLITSPVLAFFKLLASIVNFLSFEFRIMALVPSVSLPLYTVTV